MMTVMMSASATVIVRRKTMSMAHNKNQKYRSNQMVLSLVKVLNADAFKKSKAIRCPI